MRLLVSVDRWAAKLLAAFSLAPLSFVACGGGSGGTGGSGGGSTFQAPAACVNPKPNGNLVECDGYWGHRASANACPNGIAQLPACSVAPGTDQCATHADCTAKPNGYCTEVGDFDWGDTYCGCVYGCLTDADCGAGSICICGGAAGACVPGNCHTDADCGAGLLCASWGDECGGEGYYCQTATDQCMSDSDCPGSTSGFCAYDGARRVCSPDDPCAGIGRPFLVEGEERLASLSARAGWGAAGALPAVDGLAPEVRAALSARWARVGLMEHASVAAFARFVLQLLSLGAPSELVQEAQGAMADEIRHAELCFAFASAYAGEVVGPGPLPIAGALSSNDPRAILVTAIHEGCVGETVAAVEAAESAARAEDPVVRAALLGVAADEARHAELAYRFVRWALEARPELGEAAREAFAEALSRTPAAAPGEDVGPLAAHGFAGEALRREIRRAVLGQAVAPCARALLAA